MKPVAVASLGVLCLAGAVAIGVARRRAGETDDPASLAAARVLAVDALFLRAEPLRKDGRVDELPGLYRRILDLDSGNEAAIDFLSDVEARDLRTLATDDAGRVRWWRAAYDLLSTAIEANPRSARLRFRAGVLLLVVARMDPAVAKALKDEGHDADLLGLRQLRDAARLAGSLPHWGYAHLDEIARAAPRVAAERLASGSPGADEALAIGDEVLRTRRDEMKDFVLDPVEPFLPAAARLLAAQNLVKEVRRRLAASPPDGPGARSLIATYVERVAGAPDPVSEALTRYAGDRAPDRR